MTLHLFEPSNPTTCLLLMLPLTACSIANTLRGSLALKKISPLMVVFSRSHYMVTISQSGDIVSIPYLDIVTL